MNPPHNAPTAIAAAERALVLSSLEGDQLVEAKKSPVPRRQLKGVELLVLWSLRLYLLFMMAVVLYQVRSGTR
ncbi:MAG TPA: hypothetical protein VN848_09455 [Gemmatimonadales bacterium]|nr:hypothetical protein [Gemmatimonadales bacterium]